VEGNPELCITFHCTSDPKLTSCVSRYLSTLDVESNVTVRIFAHRAKSVRIYTWRITFILDSAVESAEKQ
jgi:hypothetical protein